MRSTGWVTAALVLITGTGLHAQEASALAGTWKRAKADGSAAGVYRFTAADGGLQGEMVDAQDGTCTVKLASAGDGLEGTATWKDSESGAELEVRWELRPRGENELKGRCEWKEWVFYDDGQAKVGSSGWDDYTFQRVTRVGLVTEGEAEEAFGSPVEDLAALRGGWVGAGGAWSVTVTEDGKWVDFTPVGHKLAERIRLENQRGTLRGGATLANSQGCQVELGLEDGALVGRSSWKDADLGDKGQSGWAPVKFTRIPRLDAGEAPAEAAPEPGEEGTIAGVWKRDDGLYLRLAAGPGKLEGDLVDRDGAVKARVSFEARGGLWVGRANWDGAEATWELSRAGDALTGRCEWLDAHEGAVVGRGWSARSFKRLRRVM